MRRELTDQAEAMARQRVRLLAEELRGAGLLPPDDDAEEPDLPAPVALARPPGRHARHAVGLRAVLDRAGEQISERFPLAPTHLTVVVAVAAVLLVGVAWLRISASSEAVPVPRAHTTAPLPTGTPSPSASAGAGVVVVHVAGKVRHPGVLTLPVGSRVVDAVRKAGGPRGGADLSALNLARVLVDGEQILVGAPATVGPAAADGAVGGDPGAGPGDRVSLNQATLEQLESLPGVGPVTAQKILDYRTAHGAFGSIDELLDVDGIGEKTLAELAPHLVL